MSLELPLHRTVSEIPFNKSPKDFTWEKFENLCTLLAKNEYDVKEVRPYGSQGDNQEGIDIYAFDPNKQKYLTIQCKRVKDYNPQKIENAVNTFLTGRIKEDSYIFILACTDDLRKGKRQNELIKQEKRLAELNIEFVNWDYHGITELLKKYPKIVGDVFSKDYVKAFNGEEAFEEYMKSFKAIIPYPQKINYNIVSKYISRTVSSLEENNKIGFFSERKVETIINILEKLPGKEINNKLILLSAGGYGKSAELSNAANYFSNEERAEFPIKIDLRDCIEGEGIEKLIADVCLDWQGVDEQNLILLFDGLDEVNENEYFEFIKRINIFHKKHSFCKLIISSRTNHFNTLNGNSLFKDYKILFLNDLSPFEIDKFLTDQLAENKECFYSLIDKNDFRNLLHSPFYLIYITDIFNDTFLSNNFPKTKAAIFSSIINKHFEKDNEKFSSAGINIINQKKQLTDLLKLVAFSMTQLAKNNLTLDELQILVPNESQRKLIRYSSLLDYKNNSFQFIHNLIQEYLTALCLKELDFNKVKKLIAFKPTFSKIKNKWHNPLSFLISALQKTDKKLNDIINWIVKIEPEVLINMETEKLSNELRFNIVKKIIEKYKKKGIRIPYYYFDESILGKFAGNTKELLVYVLNEIKIKTTPFETKIVCLKIIENFDNFFGKESEVKAALEYCAINDFLAPYVQNVAIRAICALEKFIDISDSYWLFKRECKNLKAYYVRSGIYHLIEVLPFESDFLDFAIEGVKIINEGKGNTVIGEENPIQRILLMSSEVNDVRKILNFLLSDKGLLKGAYSKRISFDKDFLNQLITNAIIAYSKDKSIVNDVLNIIESLHYTFIHDKFNLHFIRFFSETKTTLIAFNFFYKKAATGGNADNWIYTRNMLEFATNKDLTKIYSDFEKGIIDKSFIFSCRNSLQDFDKKIHDGFYLLITKKNNEFVYAKIENFDWDKHREKQQIKDQELLLNRILFFKAVEKVFTISKKSELTKEDLRDYNRTFIRNEEKMDNTLIIPLLRDWAGSGKIDYKAIKTKYEDEKRWEDYVINEVVRILNNKHEVSIPLKQYAINYANKTLSTTDLKDSVIDNADGGVTYTYFSARLNLFCEKWEMNLSQEHLLDLLYTDMRSVYEYEEHSYKNRPSNYVIKNVSDKKILKDRILKNIKENKLAKPVLGSHFYLCQMLKINESKAFLYKELEQDKFSELEKIRILEIYLSLGGEITDIIDIFKSYQRVDYWYWYLVDKLMGDSADLVCKELVKILRNNSAKEEDKITASLKLLSQAKLEGVRFFATYIKKNKRSPHDYHFWQNLTSKKFPLQETLNLLFDILLIPFTQPYLKSERSFDRLDEPIYNLIFIVALQSDEAYVEVIKRYKKFIIAYEQEYPEVKNINYPITSLENQYYKNKEEKITILEVFKLNHDLGLT